VIADGARENGYGAAAGDNGPGCELAEVDGPSGQSNPVVS
jgi:hypothetical protein